VPISAIVFGGRRREVAPLVYEANSWAHGVLVGASVASETTAAAVGQAGVVRRDPMAMLPFAGYNFGDYWQHWLNVGAKLKNPPRIYHVNWFRRDMQGRFLWPGYGDNLRVLAWILERCAGTAQATQTAIGNLPRPEDLNVKGLNISEQDLRELLTVDPTLWNKELKDIREYLQKFGARTPAAMSRELDVVEAKLTAN
jgi:phosphoenolpyruvate carboxykinase (GTP)